MYYKRKALVDRASILHATLKGKKVIKTSWAYYIMHLPSINKYTFWCACDLNILYNCYDYNIQRIYMFSVRRWPNIGHTLQLFHVLFDLKGPCLFIMFAKMLSFMLILEAILAKSYPFLLSLFTLIWMNSLWCFINKRVSIRLWSYIYSEHIKFEW